MTRSDRSQSTLLPRYSGPGSLAKIAIITGAVVGSVVLFISIYALLVRHRRRQTLKKDEQEDRRREEEDHQSKEANRQREQILAEQQPHWEAGYEEGVIPPQRLLTYRREFWSLIPEDREALISMNLRRRWSDDATVLTDDNLKWRDDKDRAINEAERRFVMQKWWEDQGQHALLAQLDSERGPSELQRGNVVPRSMPTSPIRHHKFVDDVELSELQPPKSPRAYQNSPTRDPVSSDSRAIAPQIELEGTFGRNPDLQIYSEHHGCERHVPQRARGIDIAIGSSHLKVPGQTLSRAAPSVASSIFTTGTWNMPAGYGYNQNTARFSVNTEAETILSHDEYRGEAQRNRAERRLIREQEGKREREARDHQQDLGNYEMRRNLDRAKRGKYER